MPATCGVELPATLFGRAATCADMLVALGGLTEETPAAFTALNLQWLNSTKI
jgi:hypothetical protein